MAAVTITSATVMKIEREEMLARRGTACLADALIRLHNVAPTPPQRQVHRKGGCRKCRWSRLILPFKNIDLLFSGGGGWRAPRPPCANRTLITVWQRQRVALVSQFPTSLGGINGDGLLILASSGASQMLKQADANFSGSRLLS